MGPETGSFNRVIRGVWRLGRRSFTSSENAVPDGTTPSCDGKRTIRMRMRDSPLVVNPLVISQGHTRRRIVCLRQKSLEERDALAAPKTEHSPGDQATFVSKTQLPAVPVPAL